MKNFAKNNEISITEQKNLGKEKKDAGYTFFFKLRHIYVLFVCFRYIKSLKTHKSSIWSKYDPYEF